MLAPPVLNDFAARIVPHPSPFELMEKYDGEPPEDEGETATEMLTSL
ncbi:hypothetical protein ACTMTF_48610 [Nonomuraea sp. ZG12]